MNFIHVNFIYFKDLSPAATAKETGNLDGGFLIYFSQLVLNIGQSVPCTATSQEPFTDVS